MKRCSLTGTPRPGSLATVRSQPGWQNGGWRCQRQRFSCVVFLLGLVITNWWAWNPADGPSPQVYAGWSCYEMTPVGPRTVMGGSKILTMPPRIAMVVQPAGTTAPGCVLPVIRSKKTPGGHTKQHQNTFR